MWSALFLDKQRFIPTARMLSAPAGISVQITDLRAQNLEEAVYAWITPYGEALRIGTSKKPVGLRLLSYPAYINRALAGNPSVTPLWEAKDWLRLLEANDSLLAVVHQPPTIDTVAGPLRPYLDIERHLIRATKPPLNRSHR